MAVVEIQRPRTDYAQLGALLGQAINPQQQLQAELLPLLFKAQLERQQSRELLRELRGDGLGNYKFSFLPSGAIKSFEKKTEKERLEDEMARRRLESAGVTRPATLPPGIPTPTVPPQVSATGQPIQEDLIPIKGDILGPTEFKYPSGIAAEKRAEEIAKLDVKKEQLRKDLTSFFAIDDIIQANRAEGGFLPTRQAGINLLTRSLTQERGDIVGQAANTYKGMVKRLRVQLVRAAGDVGNINIVEQKAAEQIIPTFFDSQRTAQLKRAFIEELSEAIDTNNGNAVRDTIQRFMQTDAYIPLEFKSVEAAEKANLPIGTRIIINGRTAFVEKD